MVYETSAGIPESRLSAWLKDAAKKYGTFNDGRVDYTNADSAPVVMCTIYCQDKILLAKRGTGLADAEGYWSTINGFIDEDKPVKQIAAQEFMEELGLDVDPKSVKVASSYTVQNPKERRSYIVFPCLVVLDKRPKIKLDWEHTDSVWIDRHELESYHILEDLPRVIDAALALL